MAVFTGTKISDTLTGGVDDDFLYGLAGADLLTGGDGKDVLKGGAGIDTLIAGAGDDIYVVNNSQDSVVEEFDAGNDTIRSKVDLMALADNVENLVLVGSKALVGHGNQLANTIKGNAGDNLLDGGLGIDRLIGGLGNDNYVVTTGDKVVELANGGSDTIISAVSWVLGKHVENIALSSGTDNIDGTGNSLNNTLRGNDGNNVLDGKSGVDTIEGFRGDDIIKVAEFNGLYSNSVAKDYINGGLDNDTLEITGANNQIDLQRDKIYSIETIDLTGSGNNSILNLSTKNVWSNESSSLTVKGDAGDVVKLSNDFGTWVDDGIANGSHLFSFGNSVALKIDAAITIIPAVSLPSYTISDAATALSVGSFFTAEAQKIVIDFGGDEYRNTGVSSIDLTGFGLEDSLVIAQHDGAVDGSTAFYGSARSSYIVEQGHTPSYSNTISDKVSWKLGSTKALIHSKDMHYSGNNTYTSSGYTYSFPSPISGEVQLTGLPKDLPDAQFAFV